MCLYSRKKKSASTIVIENQTLGFTRLKKNFGNRILFSKMLFCFHVCLEQLHQWLCLGGYEFTSTFWSEDPLPSQSTWTSHCDVWTQRGQNKPQGNVLFKITATASLPRNTVLCSRISPRPRRLSHMGRISKYDASRAAVLELPSGLGPTSQEPGDQSQCIVNLQWKRTSPRMCTT